MTNVFRVVGEHRTEPSRLLLLGDDGQFYAYATDKDHVAAVEPTEDWTIDREASPHPGAARNSRSSAGHPRGDA